MASYECSWSFLHQMHPRHPVCCCSFSPFWNNECAAPDRWLLLWWHSSFLFCICNENSRNLLFQEYLDNKEDESWCSVNVGMLSPWTNVAIFGLPLLFALEVNMVSSRFHYKQYKKPEAEKNTIEMCQVFLQWLRQAFWQSFSDSKYLLAYCGLYILADGHSVLFCYMRWVSESHWPNFYPVKYGKYTRICNSSIKTTTKHTCRRSLKFLQSILRNMHRKQTIRTTNYNLWIK